MADYARRFSRWGLWALPIWAILLFLATLTQQPDPETDMAGFADYVTTRVFLVSHLVGSIAGAAIGSLGAVALLMYLQNGPSAGRALAGMIVVVFGNILLSSVFGAAAFAQPAIGRAEQTGQDNALDFYNDVYTTPLFVTAGLALLLFAVGGVLLGSAIAGSGRLPRWTGWALAVGLVGFALSFLFFSLGMSLFSVLAFVAGAAVAWRATRRRDADGADGVFSVSNPGDLPRRR